MVAVWEPRAGVLFADACIDAHLAQARRHGADLHYEEPMLRWEPEGEDIRALTAESEFRARQLSLPQAHGSALCSRICRSASSDRCCSGLTDECFEMLNPSAARFIYGNSTGTAFSTAFPDLGNGVKVAFHHGGELTTVNSLRREIAPEEVEDIRPRCDAFFRQLMEHYVRPPFALTRTRRTNTF